MYSSAPFLVPKWPGRLSTGEETARPAAALHPAALVPRDQALLHGRTSNPDSSILIGKAREFAVGSFFRGIRALAVMDYGIQLHKLLRCWLSPLLFTRASWLLGASPSLCVGDAGWFYSVCLSLFFIYTFLPPLSCSSRSTRSVLES